MKKFFFTLIFYSANLTLIVLYLFPCSILGYFLYSDCLLQPQITPNFIISTNHLYAFMVLTILGIFTYHDSGKIKFLIKYLILLSIILEFFHFIIPNRGFEIGDLFGNITGVILVVIIYKVRERYV